MTKPVITRAWDRVVCVVSPGTGRHRIHSRMTELEMRCASEHERVQTLEAALEAEQEANRKLHAERRAAQQETAPVVPIVVPIVKVERTDEDNPTLPIPVVQKPKGITVRTLSGRPFLASIPAQPVRE